MKKAQTAVSKLTSDYSKTLKAKLTKDIAASKAQADKAKKAEEAKKSAQTAKAVDNSNQTAKSNASEVNQPQDENSVVTDPAPVNDGVAANDNVNVYQPTPQTPQAPAGGGNTSNPNPPSTGGGNAVTPPPAETFTGWVKNRAGQTVWSQGGFPSLEAAASAAAAWANAQPNPEDAWSSGAY